MRVAGPGSGLGAVRQLLDSLAAAESSPEPLVQPGDAWFSTVRHNDPGEIGQRLYWALAGLAARQPLVIAVDDVHWCDAPSLRFLGHLVRRLHHLPVLLVLSHDPAEWSEKDALHGEVLNAPERTVWRVRPLSRPETEELCRRHLGDASAPVVDACLEITDGVPYLVIEALRVTAARQPDSDPAQALRDCAPSPVAAAALARGARHGAETARALRALSVLRAPVPPRVAIRLLDLEPTAAADQLALLKRLSYLPSGDDVLVVPPVVRHAVRQTLTPSERHQADSRAALVLAGSEEALRDAAWHLLDTYPAGDARHAEILHTVASRMLSDGRYEDAALLLRRALAEPPAPDREPETLADLGTAELYRDSPSAIGHLRAAAEAETSPETRLRRILRLAHALAVTGRGEEADKALTAELERRSLRAGHELIRRASAEFLFIALSDDDVLRARTNGGHPGGSPASGSAAPGSPVSARSAADSRLPARAGRMSRAWRILSDAFACRPSGELVGTIHLALAHGLEPTDESGMGWLVTASILVWADDLDTADTVFGKAAAEADRWGAALPRATALWLNGLAAVHAGRLERARSLTVAAAELAADRPWDVWRPGPAMVAMRIAEEQDDTNHGLAPYIADLVNGPGDDLPGLWVGHLALAGRGRLRIVRGDVTGGLADLLAAGRRLTSIGCLNPAMSAWRSAAAQALLRLDRVDEAHELLAEELRLARQWAAPRALATALRRNGAARGGSAGQDDVAEALDVLAGDQLPLESARTLLVRGRLHRAARAHEMPATPSGRRTGWPSSAARTGCSDSSAKSCWRWADVPACHAPAAGC